jgi:hypothetical protein
MEEVKIIARVRENKHNKQKIITVPKKSILKKGDYVELKKV